MNLIILIGGGIYLDFINEKEKTKKLPKEYLILKLRMSINKDLYEKKIIYLDIYNKMQNLLGKKIDKLLLEFQT